MLAPVGQARKRKASVSARIGRLQLGALLEALWRFTQPCRTGIRIPDRRIWQLVDDDRALTTIAARIGRSIAAVAAALKRLRVHGFVDWLRRYVPTGNAGMRGPQVEQTSNAYRLSLPPPVAANMTAPLPEDDIHRRQSANEEARAMIAALPLDEQPAHLVDDPALAAVLVRLGRSIMQRERDSTEQHESNQS